MAVLATVLAMIPFPAATSSLVCIRGLFYPTSLLALSGCGELSYLTFQALGAGFTCSPRLHTSTRHGRPTDGTCHDLFSNYY